MARDPFAGGAFDPGGIADPESGDDSGGGGGGSDRDRDDDPPDPDPGSVTRDRGGAGAGGGGEPTVGVGDTDSGSSSGGSTGPSRQGRDDRGSPPPDPDPAPDPRNAPSATGAPGSDDGGRDAGDPADAPSATPTPGAPEQGIETGGATDRVVDAAAGLEQDVLDRFSTLDGSDVRVEREGNQLTAELTESGRDQFTVDAPQGGDARLFAAARPDGDGSSLPTADIGGPAGVSPAPDGPGGSSPPASDVGGPGGSGSAGRQPPASGSQDTGPEFGPGPNTDGGLGDPDPGGDGGAVVDDAREFVDDADANQEVVDRATTGGLLSERGESAGLLPAQLGDGGGAAIGDGRVDISETRLRETGETATAVGQSLDIGAITSAQAAAVSPFVGGQGVSPDARDLDPTADAAPGQESIPEEFAEGAASLPFDLPGAALETETAAEAGQSVLDDDLFEDFGADTVGETAVAQGRDRAGQTAGAIRENPAGFAGAVTAGAVIGAGGLSRGSTGTLRQAARAELDPRIGPFGRTFETRIASGARDFLADDRGQAELLTRPEGRESGGSTGETATDDDLGPDVGPFDRSDARLFDPSRQFGDDLGGMASDGPTVDPSGAESRRDIGAGIGGRGEPGIVGSDAESFSSRGFGDVSGTELDPDPTDTLRDDLDALGGAAGGLFGVPESEPTTGVDVGGLLGTPGGFDATGTTADLGERTRTVTTPFFDAETFVGPDTGQDTPTDVRTDQPTDTGQDTPTDLFDPPTADTPTADTPTTDTPTDQPTDQPRDTPSDTPTDIPTDQPTDRPFERPLEFGDAPEDDRRRDFGGLDDTSVTNPTRSLAEVDDRLVASLDTDGGQDAP
jgi:hypothetical protein